MKQVTVILMAFALLLCVGCTSSGGSQNPALKTERARADAGRTQVALGFGYLDRGDNEEALLRFERALSFDKNSYDAQTGLGVLFERIGRTDQAETAYRRAVKLAPARGALRNNLGQFLCRQARYPDASKEFALALEDPFYQTPAVAAANAGSCARLSGDYAESERFLRIAIERDPKSVEVFMPMAAVLLQRGQALKARAYIQRYEDSELPETEEFLVLAIRIEEKLNDLKNAQAYKQKLIEQFPKSDAARANALIQPSERSE